MDDIIFLTVWNLALTITFIVLINDYLDVKQALIDQSKQINFIGDVAADSAINLQKQIKKNRKQPIKGRKTANKGSK